mmetsp:Transcript_36414/g.85498  ORF Transcript_36414/g.85498 Transcript_36414/m.85498 type:complete len:297 (-) Transcript_36414:548-1438(-)
MVRHRRLPAHVTRVQVRAPVCQLKEKHGRAWAVVCVHRCDSHSADDDGRVEWKLHKLLALHAQPQPHECGRRRRGVDQASLEFLGEPAIVVCVEVRQEEVAALSRRRAVERVDHERARELSPRHPVAQRHLPCLAATPHRTPPAAPSPPPAPGRQRLLCRLLERGACELPRAAHKRCECVRAFGRGGGRRSGLSPPDVCRVGHQHGEGISGLRSICSGRAGRRRGRRDPAADNHRRRSQSHWAASATGQRTVRACCCSARPRSERNLAWSRRAERNTRLRLARTRNPTLRNVREAL